MLWCQIVKFAMMACWREQKRCKGGEMLPVLDELFCHKSFTFRISGWAAEMSVRSPRSLSRL